MVANDWVAPDACTLPTAEQPLRVVEFDTLFSQHLEHVERTDTTRLRMRFTGPADLTDTVRDLTGREADCCSFFTFHPHPDGRPERDGPGARRRGATRTRRGPERARRPCRERPSRPDPVRNRLRGTTCPSSVIRTPLPL